MRYILTGASGHIGNNMARYLSEVEPSADIRVLTRRPIEKELSGVAVEQVIGDLFDRDFLWQHIGAGDIVLHMAGYIDLTDKNQHETYHTNYDLTALLCDICREVGVSKFVYIGSVDGIVRPANGGAIREPTCFDPTGVAGHYGKSKAMAMQYVLDTIEADPDFPAVILLPSAVIGGHDYKPSAAGSIIRAVLSGGAEWGIRGGYNFVDVRDVCAAVYTACQCPVRGTYILSGHAVSVRALYAAINDAMGYRRRPIPLPRWLLWLLLPFIKQLSPITLKALGEAHDYRYDKAARDLCYAPRPFTVTLSDTLVFWQNEKKPPA